jgi:hypothetical protein
MAARISQVVLSVQHRIVGIWRKFGRWVEGRNEKPLIFSPILM